jgi:diguanylate cyclase
LHDALQMSPTFRTLPHAEALLQKPRAAQALLALVMYVMFAGVQHVEVLLGLVDAGNSLHLTIFNLVGGVTFYAVVRSGMNLRLHHDRSLALPQMAWAMTGICWSYAITGPARGGVILIMLLIIVFGMFTLTARQARVVAAAGIGMLGSVMLWKAVTDPAHYDPRVEGLHFTLSAFVMAATALLSVRLGKLRRQLERQRTQLTAALERIESLAKRDDLTGLLNRRGVLERLQRQLGNHVPSSPPLCVALIDLDHFKRVNDSFGHAAGDQVLRRFAELARSELRAGDVIARWGGEEFLVMMPGADIAQGLSGLDRIRTGLRASPLDDIEPGLVVSFSAGIALCGDEAALERAIERADAAMYLAKQTGRDRALAAA